MSSAPLRPFTITDRPLSLFGIVDGSFAIMRADPRTVAAIVVTFVFPTQLLTSFLQREALSSLSFDSFDTSTGTFDSSSGDFGFLAGGPVAIVVPFIALPFIGVALTYLVEGWRNGMQRSVAECLLFTLRKTHVILAAFVLSKLVQIVTVLFGTPVTMLVAPVLAAESTGPIASIRRSNQLARTRFGNLIGLLLLLMLVNVLISSAMTTLPVLGALLLNDWGWVAFFALSLVSTSVLNVLGVGVSVLAYYDTRNRAEGLDLSRRLAALQPAHDGTGPRYG